MSATTADLTRIVGSALDALGQTRIGIAVSGGGDSVALLDLAVNWARRSGAAILAVTVDHGLRAASAREAQDVAALCARLGVDHEVLHWTGWDGTGNLQDQARRARYALMTGWAERKNIPSIALGHTATDQAETVLMRLGRGSGVDGLSAMAPRVLRHGIEWVRPVLSVERQVLRDYLTERGLPWVDDPSNDDPGYDRIKARQALQVLQGLGITVAGLAETAARLSVARYALMVQTHEAAVRMARVEDGDVVFDRAAFLALPEEINRRILSQALVWVASADYGPREATLTEARGAIAEGRSTALHGCRVVTGAASVRVTREYEAVKTAACRPDQVWDGRWRVKGPQEQGLEVRALGEGGLGLCPDWRATGRKRVSLLSSPSVWRGEDLVAAPLAGRGAQWSVELTQDIIHFPFTILSH